MLLPYLFENILEAGVDEVGRGCLAGPVYAAAVILSKSEIVGLNDSKKLSAKARVKLAEEIKEKSMAWAIGKASEKEIDTLNILKASHLAMNRAITNLIINPEFLLIDGNRFSTNTQIPYKCIIKGDAKYQAIAAASIIAKTARDEYMRQIHCNYPEYFWAKNKGYPTAQHRKLVLKIGRTIYHRKTFILKEEKDGQLLMGLG